MGHDVATASKYRAYIFGVAHSPWTQCAILSCEAKGVPYDLSANWFPYWRRLTSANGYIFPTLVLLESKSGRVLSVTGGSFQIMKMLDELLPGRFPLSLANSNAAVAAQARCHHGKLEELFFEGAFERFHPLPQKLWMFPLLFAQQPDILTDSNCSPTLWTQVTRAALKAFLMVHFGSFLFLGALAHALSGHPRIHDAAAVAQQLDHWEARLSPCDLSSSSAEDGGFLRIRDGNDANYSGHVARSSGSGGGSNPLTFPTAPSYLDLALYAQLQMISTGLSKSLATRVAERPQLVAYIHRMNRAFVAYRTTNYCRHAFPESSEGGGSDSGVKSELQLAPRLEVATTLATGLFLLSPFGLPVLTLFLGHLYITRVKKTESSGKKLDPASYWGQVFAFIDLPIADKIKCAAFGDLSGLKKLTQRRLKRWQDNAALAGQTDL